MIGALEARVDGAVVRVPGGRTAELLVRLALEAGSAVRADRLVEDLWGDDAVHTDRNTLQAKVARLRRSLGPAGPLVRTTDGGYLLDIAVDSVDALAVLAAAETAAQLLDDGDVVGAVGVGRAALDRFAAEVLPALDGAWVEPHRARLEEARTSLAEVVFAGRLRLGADAELIGDLEAAVATRPYQESLWELLVTARYRAGRSAEALATIARVRSLLVDDLGLDPGPGLQALERQILDHDAALGGGGRDVGDAASPDAPLSNLPGLVVDLIGRDVDRARLVDALASHRLVELVGPGGIGKTALALEVARTVLAELAPPGGVWMVRLESATGPDEVVDALIAALGVTGGDPALVHRLRSQPTLVVLDNCEHVQDAAADLVDRLLAAAPGLTVLATSQVPLGLDGELLVEVAPLAVDESVALFERRARDLGRGRDPGEPAAVAELCRSLDGLPLAIELAAARTRTLSVPEISRRLDDRFGLLHDPTSRRPERRRALRSTIAWSYDLLFPDDQRGLWAVASFPGGAPLEGIEAVVAALGVPGPATIDVVDRLAARSLLTPEVSDDGGTELDPVTRYRVLDSIGAFARSALADAGEADVAERALAGWCEELALASTAGVRSAAQAEHLARVRRERANVDAVLAWTATHDPPQGLRIATGLGWAWIVLGDARGADRLLAALGAAGADAPTALRADALLRVGWIEASTGALDGARRHLDEALELADADDLDLRAQVAYHRAYVVSHEGRWAEALELTSRAEATYAELDRPWDRAANALFASRAAISAGDAARARREVDGVRSALAAVDDPWLHVRGEATFGELARLELRFDDAVRHLTAAAETSGRRGFRQTEAYQRASVGRARAQAGDLPGGADALDDAVRKAEATGDPRMAALARVHVGRVRRALGETEAARTALAAAASFHAEVGGGEQVALNDCLLAALDGADGDPRARHRLEDLLAAAQSRGDAPVEVFALDALARIAAGRGDLARAADLLAEADARMGSASHFISERDRVDAAWVRAGGDR